MDGVSSGWCNLTERERERDVFRDGVEETMRNVGCFVILSFVNDLLKEVSKSNSLFVY